MKKRCKAIAFTLIISLVLVFCTACSGRTYDDAKATGQMIKIQDKSSMNTTETKNVGTVDVHKQADSTPDNTNSTDTDNTGDNKPNADNNTDDNNGDNNTSDNNDDNKDDNNDDNNNDNADTRDYSTSCMSFNVLAYDTHNTGYAAPNVRIDYIEKTIKQYNPDLLGCQEVMAAAPQNGNFDTYAELNKRLTGYSHRALIEESGSAVKALTIGSGLVIYYKTSRFELKDHGAKVYAADAGRHYQWVKLYDKQEKVTLYMTNTHLSINPSGNLAAGIQLRSNEAGELYSFWNKNCGDTVPLYATGDYNHASSENAYSVLNKGNFVSSRDVSLVANASSSIDFVYINGSVQGVYEYHRCNETFEPAGVAASDPDKRNVKYCPSDHYAIIAYCYNE